MKRSSSAALLCSILSFTWQGCGSLNSAPSDPSAEHHPLLGAAAPAFELSSASGNRKISLAQFAGRVVVVDFWATWCGPCRQSFPAYQRLSEKFGAKLSVIGISVDEDPSGIAGFAKDTGARFALAWDEGLVTSKSYGPPTMPTSYIVDRAGIVRFVHSGFQKADEQQIADEISSLSH